MKQPSCRAILLRLTSYCVRGYVANPLLLLFCPPALQVPGSNSSTSDWSRPGKRTAFPAHPPVNNENESANIAPPIGNPRPTNQHATTANLLGGPVPVDARYRGDNRFETEAQAAQRSAYGGTGTQVNQLTDKARSVYVSENEGSKDVLRVESRAKREVRSERNAPVKLLANGQRALSRQL